MTDKQQIKEMARTLCGEKEHTCEECDSSDMCEFWTEASILYNAGYRKQREGEWISVDERLPDESGEYLAYTNRGNCSTLSYSARHKMFNAFDCLSKKFAKGYHIDVTHWMPIPEAPKGGEG